MRYPIGYSKLAAGCPAARMLRLGRSREGRWYLGSKLSPNPCKSTLRIHPRPPRPPPPIHFIDGETGSGIRAIGVSSRTRFFIYSFFSAFLINFIPLLAATQEFPLGRSLAQKLYWPWPRTQPGARFASVCLRRPLQVQVCRS